MAITQTPDLPYVYQQYRYADGANEVFSVHTSALLQRWAALRDQYIDLPVYDSPLITGELLTWVCATLYGVPRPILQYPMAKYDVAKYDGTRTYDQSSDTVIAPDAVLRRIVAWNCKRDIMGPFSIPVLKHKVAQFMGYDAGDVVVTQTGRTFNVEIAADGIYDTALEACFFLDLVNLPVEYNFTLTIV